MKIHNAKTLASGTEVKKIRTEFSDDEMNLLREKLADADILLSEREEQKKEKMAELNVEINDIKAEKKFLRTKIRDRFQEKEMQVLMVPDYERKMMQYVDQDTFEVLEERKMMPKERQMIINSQAV